MRGDAGGKGASGDGGGDGGGGEGGDVGGGGEGRGSPSKTKCRYSTDRVPLSFVLCMNPIRSGVALILMVLARALQPAEGGVAPPDTSMWYEPLIVSSAAIWSRTQTQLDGSTDEIVSITPVPPGVTALPFA